MTTVAPRTMTSVEGRRESVSDCANESKKRIHGSRKRAGTNLPTQA